MSARMIILLVVALVAAGATTMMVRNWIAAERAAANVGPRDLAPVPQLPEVLVAVDNMPAGMVLKPEHMRWQPILETTVSPDHFVKGQVNQQDLVGSVVRQSIAKGEPLIPARIVRPGDRGFLAAILTPGMRAVTVPINMTSGIAGLIFPGDRVDLILTHAIDTTEESKRERRASETVLYNVRILATDQRTDFEEGTPGQPAKTVTLEVNPKQAEVIAMVSELGRLALSLRSIKSEEGALAEDANAVGPIPRAERTYTLDSEVSALLPDARVKKDQRKEREILVLRGGQAPQPVTY
ncbi:pilus assembly protein CpaB [Constrictibacter sp. MBR-5]|jgi:pilus assembly protein CpaB|uniref:Flp pilus assembly protein CpaB n=1 Tax=Constrictibacter sp. MBR-5 TaxID=3156467 RepID=UPI003398E90C